MSAHRLAKACVPMQSSKKLNALEPPVEDGSFFVNSFYFVLNL
ncbi:MAG: hypothetical protein RSF33_08520 [Hydrogenoanaerobacterium sp.]